MREIRAVAPDAPRIGALPEPRVNATLSMTKGIVMSEAFERTLRILVVALGAGDLVFGALAVGDIVAQAPVLDPAFTAVACSAFLGTPLVLAATALSRRVPARLLRGALAAHALATLALTVGWFWAIDPSWLPSDEQPWIMNTVAIACCSAALAAPFAIAMAYVVVIAAAEAVLRFAVLGGGSLLPVVLDFLLTVLFSTVLVALLAVALRSARRQDAARLVAESDAVRASDPVAAQRTRFERFVRDDVLSTFDAVLREGRSPSAATRSRAASAIATMDELQADHVDHAFVDASQFEAMLAHAGGGAVPLGFSVVEAPGTRTVVPVAVADALAAAYGEALSNSVRHAAPRSDRVVLRRSRIDVARDAIDIVVSDDGRGFSLSSIPADRMGVRVGILRSVNAVPGCSARVSTRRGHGTVVTLAWRADGSEA